MDNIVRRKIISMFKVPEEDNLDFDSLRKKSFYVRFLEFGKIWLTKKWQRLFKYALILCLFVGISIACSLANLASGEWHAECYVEYNFGASCKYVSQRISSQFIQWDDNKVCGRGVRCNYRLLEQNEGQVIGTHSSANKWHVKNLTIWFKEEVYDIDACQVIAYSRSNNLFTVQDFGSNYCGIHNLMKGARLLDGHISSDESTSNHDCSYYLESECEDPSL